jgi:hypothetical protein
MKTEAPFRSVVTADSQCIGHLLRTARGWRAWDADEMEVPKLFKTADAAAAAIKVADARFALRKRRPVAEDIDEYEIWPDDPEE